MGCESRGPTSHNDRTSHVSPDSPKRSDYVMGLFWGDFFYQVVLNTIFVAYLVRPEVRRECGVDRFTMV